MNKTETALQIIKSPYVAPITETAKLTWRFLSYPGKQLIATVRDHDGDEVGAGLLLIGAGGGFFAGLYGIAQGGAMAYGALATANMGVLAIAKTTLLTIAAAGVGGAAGVVAGFLAPVAAATVIAAGLSLPFAMVPGFVIGCIKTIKHIFTRKPKNRLPALPKAPKAKKTIKTSKTAKIQLPAPVTPAFTQSAEKQDRQIENRVIELEKRIESIENPKVTIFKKRK